jgi:glycosyltransferase involved in cell wall biosynthesis
LKKIKILYIVNIDWFFVSHRLPIALEAINKGYEVHIATKYTNKRQMLDDLGFILHSIDYDRSAMGAVSLVMEFSQTLKILQKVKPNIVHLISIKPVIFGGIASRIINTENVVSAVSGLGYIFSSEGLFASIRKFFVKKLYIQAFSHPSQQIIFQNEDDKNLLISHNKKLEAKSVLVPGSGVDINLFDNNAFSPDIPIIMLVSRMLVDKGIREFVEAVKILESIDSSLHDKYRFALVGGSDSSNPATIEDSELTFWAESGTVEIWGHISNIPKVLNQSYAIVLPSYREGFPKILMEAAACGKAIITTDVPGCRDAIIPEITGILIPPKNPLALAEAIKLLLEDPLLCESMGKAGRKYALEQFDIKDVISKHMEIYKELSSSKLN